MVYLTGSSPTWGGIILKSKDLEKLPVEVRYIPLPKEEAAKKQKKLMSLLVEGAIRSSHPPPENDS